MDEDRLRRHLAEGVRLGILTPKTAQAFLYPAQDVAPSAQTMSPHPGEGPPRDSFRELAVMLNARSEGAPPEDDMASPWLSGMGASRLASGEVRFDAVSRHLLDGVARGFASLDEVAPFLRPDTYRPAPPGVPQAHVDFVNWAASEKAREAFGLSRHRGPTYMAEEGAPGYRSASYAMPLQRRLAGRGPDFDVFGSPETPPATERYGDTLRSTQAPSMSPALAQGKTSAAAQEDFIGPVELVLPPGSSPGDGSIRFQGPDGGPVSRAQTQAAHEGLKDGSWTGQGRIGSYENPWGQTQRGVLPPPGDWYFDIEEAVRKQSPAPEKSSTLTRAEIIMNGGRGGEFSLKDNPNASSAAPWYTRPDFSRVESLNEIIEENAKIWGLDPDLVKAIVYVETTQGYYDAPADVLGVNKSLLPMNINVDAWGDFFGSREQLKDERFNVFEGSRMLAYLTSAMPGASVAEIATAYNNLNATEVSDYGARVQRVRSERTWTLPPHEPWLKVAPPEEARWSVR